MARKIKWDLQALAYFEKAIDWIANESIIQAENVESGILEKLKEVAEYPEKYPPDKFKVNNEGRYRAFETYSYRVAYTYEDEELFVLRVRHIKQEPKTY